MIVDAGTTDGIEATSSPLPGLPAGAVVVMDSDERAFAVFDGRSPADEAPSVDTVEDQGCDSARSDG